MKRIGQTNINNIFYIPKLAVATSRYNLSCVRYLETSSEVKKVKLSRPKQIDPYILNRREVNKNLDTAAENSTMPWRYLSAA